MNNGRITLKLAYLYPKLLNIYGDRGNVLTLLKRSERRGIELNIVLIGIGEEVEPEEFDIYFIGGGQDQQQVLVAEDFQKKKKSIVSAVEKNAIFLAICGGYQLLGKYYKTNEGAELKGIDILDLYTIAGDKRMIGNVLCEDLDSSNTLVGFENHSGKTYLGANIKPLAKVIRGCGNNGEDNYEGARYKNVFGTYLHGSFLPKNPFFADKLISLAIERKGFKMPDIKLNDDFENMAHMKAEKLKY